MLNKIVTHSGTFHADEIIAIAILDNFYVQSPNVLTLVERVNQPTEADLNDPDTIVIDVGGRYEPKNMNFDHHHDQNLSCSAILVGYHFMDNTIFGLIWNKLLNEIDNIDRGFKLAENASISQAVANMNNIDVDEPFFIAYNMIENVLNGHYETALMAYNGMLRFDQLERDKDGWVILNFGDHIPNWRELAQEREIFFMLTQNLREPEKYTLIARDSNITPIPQDVENADFVHNNGFMAIFPTVEDALNAVDVVKEKFG